MDRDRRSDSTGLTRAEVAQILGVHVSSVRRYEEKGWLRPTGSKGEERMFAHADVKAFARLARRGRGRVAMPIVEEGAIDAAAFKMFRAGATHEQVVLALEIPAARVRELFHAWRTGYATKGAQEIKSTTAEDEPSLDLSSWERLLAEAHNSEAGWPVPRASGRRWRRPSES
jgi:transposase